MSVEVNIKTEYRITNDNFKVDYVTTDPALAAAVRIKLEDWCKANNLSPSIFMVSIRPVIKVDYPTPAWIPSKTQPFTNVVPNCQDEKSVVRSQQMDLGATNYSDGGGVCGD